MAVRISLVVGASSPSQRRRSPNLCARHSLAGQPGSSSSHRPIGRDTRVLGRHSVRVLIRRSTVLGIGPAPQPPTRRGLDDSGRPAPRQAPRSPLGARLPVRRHCHRAHDQGPACRRRGHPRVPRRPRRGRARVGGWLRRASRDCVLGRWRRPRPGRGPRGRQRGLPRRPAARTGTATGNPFRRGGGRRRQGADRLRPDLRLRCGRGEAFERVERKGPEALFERNAQVVVPAVPVAGGRGLDGGKHRPRG